MKSSKSNSESVRAGVVIKATPGQARLFLERLANLSLEPEAVDRFRRHYGRWFSVKLAQIPASEAVKGVRLSEGFKGAYPSEEFSEKSVHQALYRPILQIRNLVRSIWMTEDPRARERLARFLLGIIEQHYVPVSLDLTLHLEQSLALGEVYPPVALEDAARYLLRSLDRLGSCQNRSCPEPFFFRSHRNQRYCSPDCSLPAKRESKRRWWAEHHKEWERKRANKKIKKTRKGDR